MMARAFRGAEGGDRHPIPRQRLPFSPTFSPASLVYLPYISRAFRGAEAGDRHTDLSADPNPTPNLRSLALTLTGPISLYLASVSHYLPHSPLHLSYISPTSPALSAAPRRETGTRTLALTLTLALTFGA
jgi:hypothetical protein